MSRYITAILITVFAICAMVICTVPGREPVRTGIREAGVFRLACYDAAGNLKWREEAHNALAQQGERLFLDGVLRGGTIPAGWYLRLYNATPTGTSTLATLAASEPATANGYNPASNAITKDVTGFPSLTTATLHYQAVSKTVTITASGGTIGPVTYCALASSSDNTGKLVAYAALSATRTLQAGDSLNMTYTVRLQ